jgi:hypothetical protein
MISPVAGYLSKLLFPNTPRDQRRRRMQTLWFLLVTGILAAAAMAGLLYLVNLQGPG